jgi:hypothetical protein
MKAGSTGTDQVIQQSCYKVKSLAKILDLSLGNDSQANNEKKPQAPSPKPQAPATYCRASYRFLT